MPAPKPELLIRWPNTKEKLWRWLGTTRRITTITATPTTFHQTATRFHSEIRWLEKTFSSPLTIRMIEKIAKNTCALYVTFVEVKLKMKSTL